MGKPRLVTQTSLIGAAARGSCCRLHRAAPGVSQPAPGTHDLIALNPKPSYRILARNCHRVVRRRTQRAPIQALEDIAKSLDCPGPWSNESIFRKTWASSQPNSHNGWMLLWCQLLLQTRSPKEGRRAPLGCQGSFRFPPFTQNPKSLPRSMAQKWAPPLKPSSQPGAGRRGGGFRC